ncbi:unnamed protein product [Angiostrongylus costaricensis]|uniref:DUF1899 domain-containing protein n=1 Tax=Angiostrongylus costaricensis TaxID=334426 RepID=A0A158PDT1_ANGCS|nr:unnamed protein product [Angiostrongylus costaricensis]
MDSDVNGTTSIQANGVTQPMLEQGEEGFPVEPTGDVAVPGGVAEDCPLGSRAATFRHIFAQPVQRGEWFDWGAGHGSSVVVNPKFVAIALDGGAGGQILVGTHEDFGRHGRIGLARLQDHAVSIVVGHWSHRTKQMLVHLANFIFRVCIFDARTGNAMKSAVLPHDGGMPPKCFIIFQVLFASPQRLVTFGNTRINRRQFAIHSISSFDSPLAIIDVDGSSGQLCPIFDPDLNILYVSGKVRFSYFCFSFCKRIQCVFNLINPIRQRAISSEQFFREGDSTFRLYELITVSPYVIHLTECHQPAPHTFVCTVSKRALNFIGAEVMRVYSHFLPLKYLLIESPKAYVFLTYHFHPELYPPTRGPTPAASLAEWRAGLDAMPIELQLRPGQLKTTSKPVQLRGRSGSPKLITSDLNNEMKFRFLSKVSSAYFIWELCGITFCFVTKPDYRSLDEREDCEEIVKLIEVKQKVQEQQMTRLLVGCSEDAVIADIDEKYDRLIQHLHVRTTIVESSKFTKRLLQKNELIHQYGMAVAVGNDELMSEIVK